MDPEASRLVDLLVGAYRPYYAERLSALGVEGPDADEALAEGERWLRAELTELLQRPFENQAAGPLEIFRYAARFPNRVLSERGIPPPERDEAARRSVPEDLYDLAPASSQSLGEETWRAHLAWGAAKAAGMAPQKTKPGAAVLSTNLMDVSRIEGAARQVGWELTVWRAAAEAGEGPKMAFVDLSVEGADEVLRLLSKTQVRVVAYGPHVDDVAMTRAGLLGADEVLPRSKFFRRLPDLFPPLV